MAKKRPIEFSCKARAAQIKVDAVLKFNSEVDLRQWIKATGAVEFARDNPLVPSAYTFPNRYFYVVQGVIVEAVLDPIPPERPPLTSVVSGELPPSVRKMLRKRP